MGRARWAVPVGLVGLAVVAVATVPPEAQLGGRIRLVYVHGAAVWTALLAYSLAAALALLSLARRRLLVWARAADHVATGFWAVGLGVSFLAMKLVWGGVFLSEPRVFTAMKILVLAAVVLALCYVIERHSWRAVMIAGKTYFIWSWETGTNLVLHPDRPVLKADQPMQVSFLFVLIALVALAAFLAWAMRRRLDRSADAA